MKGLVLCGGLSSRLGIEKMSITKEGTPLYLWWKKQFSSMCSEVYISCNLAQTQKYSIPNFLIDKVEHQGPLSGLITAILKNPNSTILMAPVDLCYITTDDINYLITNHNQNFDASVFYNQASEAIYPLFGIFEPTIFSKLIVEFNSLTKSIYSVLLQSNINILTSDINLNDLNTPEEHLNYLDFLKSQESSQVH